MRPACRGWASDPVAEITHGRAALAGASSTRVLLPLAERLERFRSLVVARLVVRMQSFRDLAAGLEVHAAIAGALAAESPVQLVRGAMSILCGKAEDKTRFRAISVATVFRPSVLRV